MECFGVVAEAEGGIARLRATVRSLAVQGKLGTQSKSDQAASTFLTEFRHVKTNEWHGVRKANRFSGLNVSVEPLFEVPKNWQWALFGNVATIASRLVNPADYPNHFHIAPDNVEKGTGRLLPYRTIAEDRVTSNKHLFFSGAILYSKIRPNLSKAVVVDFEGLCSADMYPITAHVHTRYLHLYILSDSFLQQVVSADNRVAMPKVNQDELSRVIVPVPPVAEQHRIVAKVDQLMSMLDDLEQRQEKKRTAAIHVSKASLDSLVDAEDPDQFARAWERVSKNFGLVASGDANGGLSHLRHALIRLGLSGSLTRRCQSDGRVSDLLSSVAKTKRLHILANRKRAPAQGEPDAIDSEGLPPIPEEWCWTRLECLAGHIVDGTHHTPTYVEEGVCFISATNIKNRRIVFDGCRRIADAQYQELMRRCAPKRGDVLITKSGTLGEVAVVDDDRRFTLFESVALIPVVPPISPEYIAHCAEVACAGEFGKATERGVAVKHLHLRDLRRMPIPLPSVEEQERIVVVLGRLMALVGCLGEQIAARDSCSLRLVRDGLQSV